MKRLIALLLACCMVLGLLPAMSFAIEAKPKESRVLTDKDYATADLMWEAVNQKESQMHAKRAPTSSTVDALIQVVTESPYYEEDSLIRNGEFFTWVTVDGIACGYSPRLSEIARNAKPMEGYDPATAQNTLTTSYATRGGTSSSKDVYVIQPYYGLDVDFTEQYVNEGNSIAKTLGGSCTVYRTTNASIDNIANAIESGAVVFFDSHGDTDYANGDDFTTRANTSYLCLQTNAGLTDKDYETVSGPYGDYHHAYYYGMNGSMRFYCVDGTAIANHMDRNASNSLLWMAICLGMATDGLHAPLRSKGVEVAYGYSQSVTFDYDYEWEECFWDEMLQGSVVSDAIAQMKETVGDWDWCHSYDCDTISEARYNYCAFPIVVSSEDVYPGHGNVDDLQSVKSTWTLFEACTHPSVSFHEAVSATCTEEGRTAYYACDKCNALFSDKDCNNRISLDATVVAPLGHSYDQGVETTAPTCGTNGVLTYTCTRCTASYTEAILALGHEYVDGVCANCGQDKPNFTEFSIGVSGTYIIAAKVGEVYYAMSNQFPTNSGKIKGTVIQVTDGFVHEDFADDYAVTLNYNSVSGTYTIESNGVYLKYPTSTNLSSGPNAYNWTISTGINGSWRIYSEVNTRALIFRAKGYSTFGGYYTPNAGSGSTEYYDIELIPVGLLSAEPTCKHEHTTETTTPADCTTPGSHVIVCDDCGLTVKNEVIPATGHYWGNAQVISEASCTTIGETRYTCANCQESYTDTTPAYGHTWNAGVVTTQPTCEVSGVKTFTCLTCKETKEEEIPATDHNWDDGVETTAPTCSSDGLMTYTCGNCSKTRTEVLPAVDHEFLDEVCIYCGITGVEMVTPFAPGVSGNYVIAAKVGDVYYAMKNNYPSSGKVQSGVLDVSNGYVEEHYAYDYVLTLNYNSETGRYTISNGSQYLKYNSSTNLGSSTAEYSWTVAEGVNGSWRLQSADPDRALIYRAGSYKVFGGYATVNVAAGGAEYFDVEIIPVRTFVPSGSAPEDPTPSEVEIPMNHTLNLASDISINYAVKASYLADYDEFYMQCIIPVYEGNEEIETRKVFIDPELKGDYYYFTLTGLTAVQMGDVIQASLKIEANGQSITSSVDSYSISTYAYAQLNKENASEALKKLCAELLRYGTEAQTFKSYRTDSLVDAAMTETHLAYLSDIDAVTFGNTNKVLNDVESPIITWVGKALNLESKVVVKFVMNASAYTEDISQLSLRVSYTNYAGETVNLSLQNPEIYNVDSGYYAFNVDSLLAADLRSVISAAVYEGDTQVSPTVQYSPDSYGNGKTGALLNLCKALMAYSDTALAFFTAS